MSHSDRQARMAEARKHHKSQDQRRAEAGARAEVYASRTVAEQLRLVKKRPGKSAHELSELTACGLKTIAAVRVKRNNTQK